MHGQTEGMGALLKRSESTFHRDWLLSGHYRDQAESWQMLGWERVSDKGQGQILDSCCEWSEWTRDIGGGYD